MRWESRARSEFVREYLAAFPWIAVAWGVVACLYADEWLVVPFVVALMIGANSER